MTTSTRDAHGSPETMTPAGRSGPARRSRTANPNNQSAALRLLRLAAFSHMLRSRRFYERVAVGAIVLAALRGLGQENRASTLARLADWNTREAHRLEHKAKRQARRLEHKVKAS